MRLVRNLLRLWRAREGMPEERRDASPRDGGDARSGGHVLPDSPLTYDPLRPSWNEETHFEIEFRRMGICDKSASKKFDACFARTSSILKAFQQEVTQAGAELVVMLIPDEYQVDDEVRRAALEHGGRLAEDYDFALPQRRLVAFCHDEGIRCLDLLPASRERGHEQRLYRLRNTHWNEAGNALGAECLLEYLTAAGLVD